LVSFLAGGSITFITFSPEYLVELEYRVILAMTFDPVFVNECNKISLGTVELSSGARV